MCPAAPKVTRISRAVASWELELPFDGALLPL
jgi:hypothetical protein